MGVSAPAATLVTSTPPGAPPASVIVLLRPPAAVGSYWTLLRPLPVRPLTCATVTASFAATPFASPVSVRLPPVPAIVTLVPPVAAPTVIWPVPGAPPVCWTRPAVPLLRFVMAVVLPAMFAVLVVTLAFVAASWLPLTASVDVGVSAPAATLCSATGVPAMVPTSVVLFDTTPGVGVVGAAAFEYWTGPAAADVPISAPTCPRLTASVGATPAATLLRTCAVPGAAPVPPDAVRTRLFAAAPRWTVPAVPLPRLVIAVVLPAMFVVLVPTCALVAASWLPLTASVEVGVSAPAATLVTVTGPAAPPASVTLFARTPPVVSYWTAFAVAAPIAPVSWLTFAASVGATPAATPEMTRLPPVPATLRLVPPVAAATVICPDPGEPPVCWTRPTVPLLMPFVRFVRLVVFVAMLPVFVATWALVALSWLKLTASVGFAPAVTPVRVRVPPVPVRSTSVPPFAAATVIVDVGVACWTRPAVPLLRLVIALLLLVTFALVANSWLP